MEWTGRLSKVADNFIILFNFVFNFQKKKGTVAHIRVKQHPHRTLAHLTLLLSNTDATLLSLTWLINSAERLWGRHCVIHGRRHSSTSTRNRTVFTFLYSAPSDFV